MRGTAAIDIAFVCHVRPTSIGDFTPLHPDTGTPGLYLDAMPGGMGITEQGFNLLTQLWKATLAAIRECPCESGCPSCIQSPKCGNNNEPLDKQAAIAILRLLLGEQRMQV